MNTQIIIFRILVASLVVLSVAYVYMIGSITFNVIARKSLANEVRQLGTNISQLELTYLNNMNEVNRAYALSRGFVDAKSNLFATRTITHVALR